MAEPYNLKVKICLVGDSAVGKTSLIRRYVMDIFDDRYISTLGTKVSKKRLIIRKPNADIDLTFSIWDVLGQEDFPGVKTMAFKGSKGALLVCDLTRKDTLDHLLTWASRIKEVSGNIPMILLGNKADLTSEYAYSEKEVQEMSAQLDAPYFLTSARFVPKQTLGTNCVS